MSNVLFDRQTLFVTSIDRLPLPNEIQITNVSNLDSLTKQVSYKVKQNKTTDITLEDGTVITKQLYLLPQQPIEQTTQVTNQVETINQLAADGVTQNMPIMVTQIVQTPLLDESGKQVTYEQTVFGKTITVTDEPVMINVDTVNADGTVTVTQEQEKDESGNLLYWGQVGTGVMIPCFTTEEQQFQKVDADGNKLYLETVTEDVVELVEQPDKEITDMDTDYVDGLENAQIDAEKTRVAKFSDEMSVFDFSDIVEAKRKSMSFGFFSEALLYEQFDSIIDSGVYDLGLDFISLAPNGYFQTVQITLPKSASLIHIQTETNADGLQIEIGDTLDNLQVLDGYNEHLFATDVSTVYLKVTNTSSKRLDLKSLALLM